MPTQIVAAPRPSGQRGIWITFGVVAALAVLAAGLWLGTRNSGTEATGGAGSTEPASSIAPSATPPAVQIATTTPGAAPSVVTAPSATISPVTAPPVTPPPATAPPVTAPPVTAPPAHPCPTLHYNETLPLGMCDEGFPVQLMQARLNELGGYGLEEDGQFGPASQAAVRAYQTEHGLTANGTADYPTWRSLFLGVGLPGEDLNGDGVITPEEIIYD